MEQNSSVFTQNVNTKPQIFLQNAKLFFFPNYNFLSSSLYIKLMLTYCFALSLFCTPAPYKVSALAQEEVCLSPPIMRETLPLTEAAAASCKAPHRYAYSSCIKHELDLNCVWPFLVIINNVYRKLYICFVIFRPEGLHLWVLCSCLQELPQPGCAPHDSHRREASPVSTLY